LPHPGRRDTESLGDLDSVEEPLGHATQTSAQVFDLAGSCGDPVPIPSRPLTRLHHSGALKDL
jgi:hypothetical protein